MVTEAQTQAPIDPDPPTAMVQHQAPEITPVSPMWAIIDRVVTDPSFPVEKLEKLLEIQQQHDAANARKAYTAALAAFKADPPSIVKGQSTSFESKTGGNVQYQYATLDAVTRAVIPALAQHGLSHHWNIEQVPPRVTVTCVLTHRDGHSEGISMSAVEDESGLKNPIQRVASTVTYLERYTLLAITGLAAEGHDDDGHAAYPRRGDAPRQAPRQAAQQPPADAGPAAFCPIHGDAWRTNQRGEFHPIRGQPGQFCNPPEAYKARWEKAVVQAGYSAEQGAEIAAIVKDKWGASWTHLTAAQCIEVCEYFEALVPMAMPGLDADPPDDPPADDMKDAFHAAMETRAPVGYGAAAGGEYVAPGEPAAQNENDSGETPEEPAEQLTGEG